MKGEEMRDLFEEWVQVGEEQMKEREEKGTCALCLLPLPHNPGPCPAACPCGAEVEEECNCGQLLCGSCECPQCGPPEENPPPTHLFVSVDPDRGEKVVGEMWALEGGTFAGRLHALPMGGRFELRPVGPKGVRDER